MTRRAALLACLLLLAAMAAAVALANPPHKEGPPPKHSPAATREAHRWVGEVDARSGPRGAGPTGNRRPGRRAPSPYWHIERRYRAQQHRMGLLGAEVRRLRASNTVLLRRRRVLRRLQASDVAAQARAVVNGLLCIHSGEAAWDGTDNATHRTYFGGLQLDATFQANYAPARLLALGTADHWTPLEQLAVGLIGWSLQGGYAPWPTTSRACGLR